MSTQAVPDQGKLKHNQSWLQRVAANLGFSSGSGGLRETLARALADADADDEDPLPAQERAMLVNVLGFGALRVSDIMVPRAGIVAIGQDRTLEDLFRLFAESEHSRLPVYKSSLDDAIGMILLKDAMALAVREANGRPALDLSEVDLRKTIAETSLTRELLFVPTSMPAIDLLARMRAQRIHLAIVIDEFGGTDGLVSMEDLVEAIVGDIADEHDTDEVPITGSDAEGYIADARAPIKDVEAKLHVSLATEEVDTLGGLIMAMEGSVPKLGHVVSHPSGLVFEVLEAGPRLIHKVRISRRLSLPAPMAADQVLALPSPQAHEVRLETADAPNVRAA